MLFIWIAFWLWTLLVEAAPLARVRINPSSVLIGKPDYDFDAWTVTNEAASSSFSLNGLTFGLSASGTTLKGNRYKWVSTKMQPFLGERIVGEGISTTSTTSSAITLTIRGLAAGSHSLVAYHNAWDNLATAANIRVTVNGATVVSVSSHIADGIKLT